MFSKATSLGLSAAGLGGELDLDLFNQKKGPMHIGVKAQSIDLSELPGVRETINLPITGTFEMSMDLASRPDYADADGTLSFKCKNCVLGDSRTPLKVEGNPLLSGGSPCPGCDSARYKSRSRRCRKGRRQAAGSRGEIARRRPGARAEIQLHDPLPMSALAFAALPSGDTFLKARTSCS